MRHLPKLRLLRISPHVYQTLEQHEYLATAVAAELHGTANGS